MVIDEKHRAEGRWTLVPPSIVRALALTALLAASPAQAAPIQVFETTADGAMLLVQQPSIDVSPATTADAVITVTPSRQLQPWAGVGGAMTDSSAVLLAAMPAEGRHRLMSDLFAPDVGAGFSLVRVPMGASDFSAVGNYNEEPMPGQFDFSEDERVIIPQLREAHALAPNLRILAAPWSPPAWMKTSGTMNGGHFDPKNFDALADYFVAFVTEYKAHGLPIFAVSVQNEPLNSQGGYPTEYLSAADEASFIADHLTPRLRASAPHVRIFGLEDNWADLSYLQTLAGSPAAQSIAGYSFHCYKGSPSQMADAAASLTPGQGLWMTECTGTSGGTFGEGFAFHMHQIVIAGIRNGARGIVEWNLALDQNGGPTNGGCKTCTGIVTVDTSTAPRRVIYGPVFYALSQVSRFVRPGAHVIDSSSSGAGMESAAFTNTDGKTVLVAFNDDKASHTFSVVDGGRRFGYTLPAKGAATFVWQD